MCYRALKRRLFLHMAGSSAGTSVQTEQRELVMSWFLYRLGRWSFRHRWAVIAGWVTALVIAGAGAATLSGPTVDSFTLKGLESTEAFALIKERTPKANPDGATSRIIFEVPEGTTLAEHRAEV